MNVSQQLSQLSAYMRETELLFGGAVRAVVAAPRYGWRVWR